MNSYLFQLNSESSISLFFHRLDCILLAFHLKVIRLIIIQVHEVPI